MLALVLAAEQYAVYQSADRGRTWSPAGVGLPAHSRINAFGTLGALIFAGSDDGLYVSRDQGRRWQAAAAPPVRALSFVTARQRVYAGTARHGLLTSADGQQWLSLTTFPSTHVRSLATDGVTVYAGTDAQGVFASRDAGQTWRSLAPGLPAQAQIFALAVHQGRLFAALYAKGLYVWSNRWAKVGMVQPLALASNGDTLVAGHNPGGIYWSADGGATWSAHGGAVPRQAPVWELAPGLAGAASGLYYSEDGGRTWTLAFERPGIAFLVSEGLALAAVVAKTPG